MRLLTLIPQRAANNVAGAIYGLILGSSVIVASAIDHHRAAGIVELYLCATALIFYLAHVYARVIAAWMDGEPPSARSVRAQLGHEWPMVGSQLVPAFVLLLGAIHLIDGRTAITVAFSLALAGLMGGVALACRKARATPRQTALSLAAAGFFAAVVIVLKVSVH